MSEEKVNFPLNREALIKKSSKSYDGPSEILIGQVIEEVIQTPEGVITFRTSEYDFIFECYADCCSNTWIESFDDIDNLIGEAILEIIDKELSRVCVEEFEVIQLYGIEFVTKKGCSLLDFRNQSNGYYGGSLELKDIIDRSTLKSLSDEYQEEKKVATQPLGEGSGGVGRVYYNFNPEEQQTPYITCISPGHYEVYVEQNSRQTITLPPFPFTYLGEKKKDGVV